MRRLLPLALLPALLPAPSASAAAQPVINATGTIVPVAAASAVVGTCAVVVTGAPVITTVLTECHHGADGVNHPAAVPGPVAVSVFAEQVTRVHHGICWAGYVIPAAAPDTRVEFDGCNGP